MWRSTAARLMSLGEAHALLANDPTDVVQIVGVLKAHLSNAGVVNAAMPVLSKLDSSDDASIRVAESGIETIVDVMRVHVNELPVKEHCARSIANMALAAKALPKRTTQDHAVPSQDEERSATETAADRLVELGAAELVVGLLNDPEALSAKGRVWAAAALLHIAMFSNDGAHRAAQDGAEAAAVELIRHCCRIVDAMPTAQREGSQEAVFAEMAVDAAMASIMRMVSLQTVGESTLQYRYQKVSLSLVEGLVRAMVTFGASFPIQHKGWEALQLICSQHSNLFLVYQAIHDVDKRGVLRLVDSFIGATEQLAAARAAGSAPEVAETLKMLQSLCDAAMSSFVELTAPRHDIREGASVEEASYTLPIESALTVVDGLTAGRVGQFAVREAFRIVREHGDARPSEQLDDAESARLLVLLSFLTNSAETDVAIRSANVQQVLCSIVASHRLLNDACLQKVLACVWNVMNFPDAIDAMRTLKLDAVVREVVAAKKDALGQMGEQLVAKLDAILGPRDNKVQ